MKSVGPLLQQALNQIDQVGGMTMAMEAGVHAGATEDNLLPIVVQMDSKHPEEGESWKDYSVRIREYLDPMQAKIDSLGASAQRLIAANAIQAHLNPEQIHELMGDGDGRLIELDPLVQVTSMNDAVEDVGLPGVRVRHPNLDGRGVIVAVLDSGIDSQHPYLNVADAISTSGQSTDQPGDHGTHCAGSIASTDAFYPGIAPAVRLLDIKVLRANGSGQHTFIAQGVDAALDRGAHILSMSLGFNHRPTWSMNGHGWHCPDGRCPLCTAVDNAVRFDETLVVVAAGNEHQFAEDLRNSGHGGSFDTELGCPGQARRALTVGALTKSTFSLAPFSSHGPSAYGTSKPDLSAPGVNIMSTIVSPKGIKGQQRSDLFARKSGTSMATPIVAGAAALLIQQRLDAGQPWTPDEIRQELLTQHTRVLPFAAHLGGAGRLDLSGL